MISPLVWLVLVLAAVPALLFLINLVAYRRLARAPGPLASDDRVSVLIPARNEAMNIRAAVESALANRGVELQVIVLDDHSTDRTADIVGELATQDFRVRLASAPVLPAGWCGKQHACYRLAGLTGDPWLVFVDADVRLAPDALARMVTFMKRTGVALASGVPRQEVRTWSEQLLVPLIHFVLLGFLPFLLMRWTRRPAFSAGCGQLFIARAGAYVVVGGHAAIRSSLHDGIKLPRLFRQVGFRTDLFDGTDLACCRMFRTDAETWRGLAKNAVEGLAAPGVILPMTALLLCGQIAPVVLLVAGYARSPGALVALIAAWLLSLLPRAIAAARFRQPWLSAVAHPLGIAGLVGIQWWALGRDLLGLAPEWKGRSYANARHVVGRTAPSWSLWMLAGALLISPFFAVPAGSELPGAANGAALVCPAVSLEDQFGARQPLTFPTNRVTILTVADQKGAQQIDDWVKSLKERYHERLRWVGVADVTGIPSIFRNRLRSRFQEKYRHAVLLDWEGVVTRALRARSKEANVYLLDPNGKVAARESGPAEPQGVERLCKAIDGQSALQ